MKCLIMTGLLLPLIFAHAGAAELDGCNPSIDNPNTSAIIAALTPKSQAQIQACAARGIRLSPNVASPPETDGLAVLGLPILFDTGSAALSPATRPLVDALGKALGSPSLRGYRFRIEGHTDTVGGADYNRDLSRRRALAVTTYLVETSRVEPARLETAGLGFDRPLVPTPPGTSEPRNRRVQIVNLGPAS